MSRVIASVVIARVRVRKMIRDYTAARGCLGEPYLINEAEWRRMRQANRKVNSRVRLFAISVILCRSVKYVCPRHEAGICVMICGMRM